MAGRGISKLLADIYALETLIYRFGGCILAGYFRRRAGSSVVKTFACSSPLEHTTKYKLPAGQSMKGRKRHPAKIVE